MAVSLTQAFKVDNEDAIIHNQIIYLGLGLIVTGIVLRCIQHAVPFQLSEVALKIGPSLLTMGILLTLVRKSIERRAQAQPQPAPPALAE